jgi:hypothetical protein
VHAPPLAAGLASELKIAIFILTVNRKSKAYKPMMVSVKIETLSLGRSNRSNSKMIGIVRDASGLNSGR